MSCLCWLGLVSEDWAERRTEQITGRMTEEEVEAVKGNLKEEEEE